MASVNDIDVKAAVGRFLRKGILTPTTDDQADTEEEIRALLESVATSFLLFPQAALPLVMRAKNSFQQIVQADIQLVDFLIEALGEVDNPTTGIDDISDLIEAQTALVELDRLQKVSPDLQAFTRYRAAVDRFLADQLAPTLKRRGKREFERTGAEARQDIFSAFPQFSGVHSLLVKRFESLRTSISDFRSVGLSELISLAAITKVRSSLRRVQGRASEGTISKTTLAVELLAGAASLESVSGTGDVFDPTISTGSIPALRSITLQTPPTSATVLGSFHPVDVSSESSWFFKGRTDPLGTSQEFDFEFPGSGASGRAYVSSEGLTDPLDLPTGATLYLFLEGATTEDYEIALTSGSVALSTVISEIDAALGSDGSCIQNPGATGLLIYGSSSVTSLVVRMDSSGSGGTYTDPNTNPSVHEELGFSDNQTSHPIGVFSAEDFRLAIHNQLPGITVSLEGDDRLRLTSDTTDPRESSLQFDASGGAGTPIQDLFGFSGTIEAEPGYLEFFEDGEAVLPEDLGVFIGSLVTAAEDAISGSTIRTLNREPITDIAGTQVFFSSLLPRDSEVSVTVLAPVVSAVQSLLQVLNRYAEVFDDNVEDLRLLLSPITAQPTRAQINDATDGLQAVRADLSGLLADLEAEVVREDRSAFEDIAKRIIRSLEERGLDRASELLLTGRFSAFFALSKNEASRSSRFLRAMESVVTSDLPLSTIEVDIDDGQEPIGESPHDPLDDIEGEDEDPLGFGE